jgi:hypothetical protein
MSPCRFIRGLCGRLPGGVQPNGPELIVSSPNQIRRRQDPAAGSQRSSMGPQSSLNFLRTGASATPLRIRSLPHPGSAARKSAGCRQKSERSPNFSWSNLLNRRLLIFLGGHNCGFTMQVRCQSSVREQTGRATEMGLLRRAAPPLLQCTKRPRPVPAEEQDFFPASEVV